MKLKSNRTLILAIILTSVVGLITLFDYIEKVNSNFSGPNDYLEVSNYQGSPEPTRAERWLTSSTSSETDPAAGNIFINLFEQGEMDKSVDIDYRYLEKAPNLIYASLVSNQWQAGREIKQEVLFERLKQAPWHLEISWNSPRQVFTQDKVSLKPEYASLWQEKEQLLLAVNDRVLTVNDEYSQTLKDQVKQVLASKQTQLFEDGKVSLKYPQGCDVEESYNPKNQVSHYSVRCSQGDQAGVTVHVVPKEAVSEYDLGGLSLKQQIIQDYSEEPDTGSAQIEVEQKQTAEVNGSRVETVTKTTLGEDLIVATSVDADLLEEVVSSIEVK